VVALLNYQRKGIIKKKIFEMKKLLLFIILAFTLQSCEDKKQKTIEKKEPQKITETKPASEDDDITSFCNFAVITDKDGYVNVREKESADSKIIGKIKSGGAVFIFEDLDTDWLNISFDDNKKSGYIHRSRIKYIKDFEKIASVDSHDYKAIFHLNNIDIDIQTDDFDYESNKKYFSETAKEDFTIKKYKGREMWGTDGTIPQSYYQFITVKIGNQEIEIPKKDIEDLFNPNNDYTECYYDKVNNSIYIHLSNSDGSGSYVALFKIENGVYKGRQVEIPF